jgi:hypothetical protein
LLPNSKDSCKVIAEQRKNEVNENRKLYKWGSDPRYTQDLPGFMEAKDPQSLPKDVQFTDEATLSLFRVGLVDFQNLGLSHIFDVWDSWDCLEDFRQLITPVIPGGLPHAAKYWRDDVWFGSQFLNGSNPEVIRKCKKLPNNFPVKNEMVDKLLDPGYNLEKAMKVCLPFCGFVSLSVGGVVKRSTLSSLAHSIFDIQFFNHFLQKVSIGLAFQCYICCTEF